MSERIEHTREGLEHAHHHAGHGDDHPAPGGARGIAILIATLAALLALCDMGAKSSQNNYLTYHINWTNDWSFYQAKNVHAVMRDVEVSMLESLPNVRDEAVQMKVVQDVRAWFSAQRGWSVTGVIPSPIEGGSGNREFLLGARFDG